jgi:HK97 family phage major capsid protein
MPRVIPKAQTREFQEELDRRRYEDAKREASRSGRSVEDILVDQEAENAWTRDYQERMAEAAMRLEEKRQGVYRPGGPHSYFRDLIADTLARNHARRLEDATFGASDSARIGSEVGELFAAIDSIDEVRARLASVAPSVEQRDVTSADPGAATFLGPDYLGELFNTAARAEASLAGALGLQPMPEGVKQIDIPRIDTGTSATVAATEGSNVSETDFDGATQPGKIGVISGRSDLSIQAAEWMEPSFDVVLAKDLGKAIGASLDAQLIAGTNANGQTLGLANVTGIKTVAYTDASATTQEFIGKTWAAYDQIANGGQGTASPDEYMTVIHPRRLAWLYANPQNAQTIEPRVPGRIVPCAGLRTALGAGTNEDEAYVILPAELPVFASSPVSIVVDENSLSGTMQIRLVAYRAVATGFGRAPAAICRISGTGMVAPSL